MSLLFVFTYIHKAKLTFKCFEQFNLFLNIVCFDQNVLARLILNACFGFNIMLSQWNCDYQLRHLQCSRLDLSPEALQTQWETEKVLSGSYTRCSVLLLLKNFIITSIYHHYHILSSLNFSEASMQGWELSSKAVKGEWEVLHILKDGFWKKTVFLTHLLNVRI